MKNHHVLNQNNLNKLAIEFTEKSNGVTTCPKTPSLAKVCHKRWESDSILKLTKNTMKNKMN